MVRATGLVSFIHGISHGENLSTPETLRVYKNLRVIVVFLGLNLIVHGALAMYYGLFKPMAPHPTTKWDQVNNILCITTSSIALVCGLSGIVAGLTNGTGTARICVFGWLVMALNQVARTTMVLIRAHRHSSHVNPHVEGIILAETFGLVLMEALFIYCLCDYIKLCRWYKNAYSSELSSGYEPLLDASDLEEPNTVLATAPILYA